MLSPRLARYDSLIDFLVEALVLEFDAAQAAANVVDVEPEANAAPAPTDRRISHVPNAKDSP
jgi:hypothetical protein